MSEKTDYQQLKKNVVKRKDRLDRIENHMIPGMPDINFCAEGVEVWIELKSPVEPKKEETPLFGSNHKVSQDQKNWMLRQRLAGGMSFFLIGTDQRWILAGSSHADHINGMTVSQIIDVAQWNTLKPIRDKEQWQYLRRRLITW